MAIPPNDTYSNSREPSLEELIKILKAAKHITLEHYFAEDAIVISFRVTKVDAVNAQLQLNTTGSQFFRSMLDSLERLAYFEELTKENSNPDKKGATAADLVAFLQNEIRHCSSGNLEDTMKRRMFKTLAEKMTELGQWRAFVDTERFRENMRAQKEAKARYEEAFQREKENMRDDMRRKAQADAEAELKRERDRRKGQAGPQENPWGSNGPYNNERAQSDYEDIWKRYRAYADGSGFEDLFRNGSFGQRGQQRRTGPDVGSGWAKILGVPAEATKAQIKDAWRKLAKLHHPDRAGGNSAKMAEINAAKDAGLAASRA